MFSARTPVVQSHHREIIYMGNYANPETLVITEWAVNHARDPDVRLVEVDVDTSAYDEGHVPGAIGWAWNKQLCDTVRRDILSKPAFEELMSESGIGNDTTVVLYGDNNNWFAAWAFWQMKIYGHKDVRIINGGRKKWLAEGRELATDVPSARATQYMASEPDNSLRAFLAEVQTASKQRSAALVDVRSPQEFTGEILAPPGLPETCQRGGHIPNAQNVPWATACREDGTFQAFDDLKRLYAAEGFDGSQPVITYCRIGERSSHTWFVLKYLLGYTNVTNYDGSWTEWGNLVGVPVERGATAAAGRRP
ncbi:MAG TPA: sulfurtransferase [Bryobacteraceae bacterium]|nr:sulfurtransferase [Bryobacteraceae bacterium]